MLMCWKWCVLLQLWIISFGLLARVEAAPGTASAQPASATEASIFDVGATVEVAGLHAQTLQEAPANVSIITAEDIRHYGYRTLGEALSQARGFYTSYDRGYHFVGTRGLLLSGDYNTRFLVMINGHNMTENVFGSNNFFGQDFGLDMDLVKQIEIIRGPSSTLYGSNGVFATINIVTKSPAEMPRGMAASDYGSYGSRKAFAATSVELGGGAILLLSGSLFRSTGQNLYFPEFDDPATNNGWANSVDGESAYHSFAQLVYRNWTVSAYFNARQKDEPAAPYGTLFDQRSATERDARDFVELGWLKETSNGTWRWRMFYDRYHYDGWWDLANEENGEITHNRDYDFGASSGTQLTYRRELPRRWGAVTLGSEFTGEISSRERNWDAGPGGTVNLDIDSPDRKLAVFLQHEYPLTANWNIQTGMRWDFSYLHGAFASPRVGLINRHSPRTTLKILFGTAFRYPTSSEEFYEDNGSSQVPNHQLVPERSNTIEAVLERKVGRHFSVVTSGYHYRLEDLILAVPIWGTVVQYQNAGRLSATGVESEVKLRVAGLETSGSVTIQQANDAFGQRLANSPACLVYFRAGRAITRNLFGSVALQDVGERLTGERNVVPQHSTLDSTFTATLTPSFDLVFGARNLTGKRYRDPTGFGLNMDTIEQDGRSVFVRLVWRSKS